jgi:hypothetical protein
LSSSSTRVLENYRKDLRKKKKKAIKSFFSTASLVESQATVAGNDAGNYATWFAARMDHRAEIVDLPPQH